MPRSVDEAEDGALPGGPFAEAAGFARTRVPKAAELVAQELRRRIVVGELSEGDTLPGEVELMRHFRISRPTLREAIRILESQDLISLRRGQRTGAEVHLPTIEHASLQTALVLQVQRGTVAEIMEAWLLLEPKVVAMLALKPSCRVISTIRKSLANDEKLIEQGGRVGQLQRIGFHRLLIETNENTALSILLGIVERIMEKHFDTVTARHPWAVHARYDRAVHKEHEQLIDLLEAGDVIGAENLWRKHLRTAGEGVLKEFGGDSIIVLPV